MTSKEFSPLLQDLARSYHDTIWLPRHVDSGWQFGLFLDKAKKIAPEVSSYDELSDEHKRKLIAFVFEIPSIINGANYILVKK